ncbi:MAG: hypothetical protein H6Q54_1238 [Deltaproteobacteria bacterium]|nr:hypothetical protein [Deltaproteobacteria bacterium]
MGKIFPTSNDSGVGIIGIRGKCNGAKDRLETIISVGWKGRWMNKYLIVFESSKPYEYSRKNERPGEAIILQIWGEKESITFII